MRTDVYRIGDSEIKIPIAESYCDCLTLIKSDRFRVTGKIESTSAILLHIIKPFSSSVLFWLRLCQYNGWLKPFCKYMFKRASRKHSLDIHQSVKIGYGFYIGHGICMVVNGGTVIGNNVNLSQFLNIGTNRRTPAIIGNDVYVGPSVCIVEDVRIGSGASIGAGAVVTKDIPENATAIGIPARVLNYNNPGLYIKNRWESF